VQTDAHKGGLRTGLHLIFWSHTALRLVGPPKLSGSAGRSIFQGQLVASRAAAARVAQTYSGVTCQERLSRLTRMHEFAPGDPVIERYSMTHWPRSECGALQDIEAF